MACPFRFLAWRQVVFYWAWLHMGWKHSLYIYFMSLEVAISMGAISRFTLWENRSFRLIQGEHDRHHLTLFASWVQRCFSRTTVCEWMHRLFKRLFSESSKNQIQVQIPQPQECVQAVVMLPRPSVGASPDLSGLPILCSYHGPFQPTNRLRTRSQDSWIFNSWLSQTCYEWLYLARGAF